MAEKVKVELEKAKHEQDLPEVSRAAEEHRRSEQEKQSELQQGAQIEESRRARFLRRDECA